MNRIAVILFAILLPAISMASVKLVASTSDLAYFAAEVGGDLVEVDCIAPPNADIHFIEVRPSYMMKLSRADITLEIGLELDMWMDKIIDGSRNSNLEIVDCSRYIQPLEVPDFKVDASHGDLHRFGNPHYWLDPNNAAPITRAIVEGLSKVDPSNAPKYSENRDSFLKELKAGLDSLTMLIGLLDGLEIVYYHNSWPYFNSYTGIKSIEFIEPYPGVPPSPSHIKELTSIVKERNIRIIAVEPYFDHRVPDKIASASDAVVIDLYPSIGGRKEGESYIEWFEGNINAILDALK